MSPYGCGIVQNENAGEQSFVFRGNVFASSGYLTQLDEKPVRLAPDRATVHGESSLPPIGGVSHRIIEQPDLLFPEWVHYGRCEVLAEGTGDESTKTTRLQATVLDVRISTRPSKEDNRPELLMTTFHADQLSIAVESIHPRGGQSSFKLIGSPTTTNMRLVHTLKKGKLLVRDIELEYEQPLLEGETMIDFERKFREHEDFFQRFAPRIQTKTPLCFGDPLPLSNEGYVFTSIVSALIIDGKRSATNVLTEPGFGTLRFGELIADGSSRRISLVNIQFGSDPKGKTSHGGVDTNGVWN